MLHITCSERWKQICFSNLVKRICVNPFSRCHTDVLSINYENVHQELSMCSVWKNELIMIHILCNPTEGYFESEGKKKSNGREKATLIIDNSLAVSSELHD